MTSNSSPTHQQRAYDFIKMQIMNLAYKPGEVITDSQVATELGISRTPVREAFYRLENEELLVNLARRGWRVYSLSLEDIHEIFDIKIALEGMAARKAAECDDKDLKNLLRTIFKEMKDAAEAGDSETWQNKDIVLHRTIFEMAGNQRAYRIVMNLNDQWHRIRVGFTAMSGRMGKSIEEHATFVEAILDGDGPQAETEIRRHLEIIREELETLLVNLVLPFVKDGI